MKKLITLLLTFNASLFTLHVTEAQIIHVPADQPTIQAGINAANTGDTVLVADGTYLENINFMGKAITVASHFILDADTNHINSTIIDGSQPDDPDHGSVVAFDSGEDTTSVITGFTITGGSGIYVPALDLYGGGGIGIENNSGAKITHNHIEYNAIVGSGGGSGGGIGAGDANNTSYVVILNNRVCNNSVIVTTGSEGGGMCIFCNAIIKDNIICNNVVISETATAVGGGIRVIGYITERYIECMGNLVAYNAVSSESLTEYAGAAGIQVFRCYGKVSNNTIMQNTSEGNLGSIGGGVFNAYSSSDLLFENNFITENKANYEDSGGKGGGFYLVAANPKLVNNLLTSNYASLGGGIYSHYTYDYSTQLINNTIASNQDGEDGGAILLEDADMVVLNTILWENDNNEGNEIAMIGNSSIEVAYSVVTGGWPGSENIDEDPLFELSGPHPYALLPNSPCIDAGTTDTMGLDLPPWDIMGNYRLWDGNYDGDTVVDIGAYEFGATPFPTGVFEHSTKLLAFSIQIYPNPAREIVNLQFTICSLQPVSMKIYDLNGRVVAEIMDTKLPAGENHFSFDVSGLPDGMYFLQMAAGVETVSKKLIVLR